MKKNLGLTDDQVSDQDQYSKKMKVVMMLR